MTSETPQTPETASGTRESAPPAGGGPAGDRGPRPMGGPRGPRTGGPRPFGPPGARRPRRKVCVFCLEKVKRIDYKDRPRLQRFLSDRAKIDPRRKSGNCAKHQRMLTTALKRARFMALLPYTAEHVRAMMSPQARALAGGPPPPRPERGPRPPYTPRPMGPVGGAPAASAEAPRPEAPRPEAPRAEAPRTDAAKEAGS